MAARSSGSRYAALNSDTDDSVGDGSHLADDSVVAFAFYNVGLQNKELLGKNWKKPNYDEKKTRFKVDISNIFRFTVGIQALFISEFGQMHPNIDEIVADTAKVFLSRCFATFI